MTRFRKGQQTESILVIADSFLVKQQPLRKQSSACAGSEEKQISDLVGIISILSNQTRPPTEAEAEIVTFRELSLFSQRRRV
jgi:hypothetical protein